MSASVPWTFWLTPQQKARRSWKGWNEKVEICGTLVHHEKTAGGLMTTDFLSLGSQVTVGSLDVFEASLPTQH
jgi:hypothetical protein